MIVRPDAPRLTVAEYRNLPETGPRYQLIEGDLYMTPVPDRFHQDIIGQLYLVLANYLKRNPIGLLFLAREGGGTRGAEPSQVHVSSDEPLTVCPPKSR